jgi:GT2 family glycosyltransferase
MYLSVIIVNWNTRDLLARCLESLASDRSMAIVGTNRATRGEMDGVHGPAGLLSEVIVVDNGSTDGSSDMVREEYPYVHLMEMGENAGFSRANNVGIRKSQGRYVVLLNSDTEVQYGALPALVTFMGAHPRVGACGPRLLNTDGTLQSSCHPMLTPGREFWRLLFLEHVWSRATYQMRNWDVARSRQVEVIKGACLMLRQEALDEVGLLDESYFMYTEEVDLCYRLGQAGWELWWVPQAQVVHLEAQSSRQVAEEMYVELYRSKVRFYRKFGGVQYAARFKRFVQLAYWPRLVSARLAAPFSPSLTSRALTYRRLLAELPGM